jgi:ribosomal protein S17E
MSIKNTGKNILDMKPAEIDSDFNDLEEMLENHSKIGSK